MKEILKYLRQKNSLTQSAVSEKLEISRQSYIKYENGSVIPPVEILRKLAEIYNVDLTAFLENKLPFENENKLVKPKKQVSYSINNEQGLLNVASPDSNMRFQRFDMSKVDAGNVYDAYFDGNTVRVIDNVNFKSGQKFKLVKVETDDEKAERKRKAWETIEKFAGKWQVPDDWDYKDELMKTLDERYQKKL